MSKEIAYDLFSGQYIEGNWTEEEEAAKRREEASRRLMEYYFGDQLIHDMFLAMREAMGRYREAIHYAPPPTLIWFDEATEIPETIWDLKPPPSIPHWQVLNGGNKPWTKVKRKR